MERTQRKDRIEREMRAMAQRLIADEGKPYPFSAGQCLLAGKPCCVFGQVLVNAGPFPELADDDVRTNGYALARALMFPDADYLPTHLVDAVTAIGEANDQGWDTDRPHRAEVADRLFYAADVLAFADIPAAVGV